MSAITASNRDKSTTTRASALGLNGNLSECMVSGALTNRQDD